MKALLEIKNISKSYQVGEMVLKHTFLSFHENSFTCILGPSGSGKSTLLNIAAGLLSPTSGEVIYQGVPLNLEKEAEMNYWKRNETGIIFQNYRLLSNLTVRENIEIGKSPKKGNLPLESLTTSLDFFELLNRFPSQLSGGQKQRTCIARAVIKKPKILFCDEATGALDEENSKKVVKLLHMLKLVYGISVLFVTHNKSIAQTADRVICMKNGIIESDEINKTPIDADNMVWG